MPPDPKPTVPAGSELHEVLNTALGLSHGLVGPQSPTTGQALARDRELRAMYADYGHGSAHDTDPARWPAPAYVLARQPESPILAELLTHRPLALTGAMEDTPTEIYLEDMATAWPHRS